MSGSRAPMSSALSLSLSLPAALSPLPRSAVVVLGALLLVADAASPLLPRPPPGTRPAWGSRRPRPRRRQRRTGTRWPWRRPAALGLEVGGGRRVGGARGPGGRGWRLEEDSVVLYNSSARWSPTVHLQLPCPLLLRIAGAVNLPWTTASLCSIKRA